MKKLFIFVVSALLAVGVLCCVACGDDNDDNKNTPSFRTEVTEEEFKTACTALNSVKNWYYESSSDNPEYIPSLKAYQDSENGVAHFVFLGEGGVTAGESYIVLNGDKVETYSYEVSGVSTVSVPVAEEQQAEWEYDAQTFSSAESAEEYFGSYLITPADVTEVFKEKFADCEYDAEKKCYLYTLTTDDADFAQNAVFEVYFQDANLVSVTENIQIENKVEDTTATGKYVFNQFGAVASADVTVPQSVKDAVADKTVYTVTEEEWQAAISYFDDNLNSVYAHITTDNADFGAYEMFLWQSFETYVAYYEMYDVAGVEGQDFQMYYVLDGTDVQMYQSSVYAHGSSPDDWSYSVANYESVEDAMTTWSIIKIGMGNSNDGVKNKYSSAEYDESKKCYTFSVVDHHDGNGPTGSESGVGQTVFNYEYYFEDGALIRVVTSEVATYANPSEEIHTRVEVENFNKVPAEKTTVPQSVKDAAVKHTVTEAEWQAAFEHFIEVKTLKSTLTTDHPEEVGCRSSIAYQDYENYVIYATEYGLDTDRGELEGAGEGEWDASFYTVLEGFDAANYISSPYKHGAAPQEWSYASDPYLDEETAKAELIKLSGFFRFYDMLADKFELFEYDSEKQCYSCLYSDPYDHSWATLFELYFVNGELIRIVEEDNTTRTVYEDFGKDFGDKTVFPESIRNQAITYTVDETKWGSALSLLSLRDNYISEITAYNPEDAGIISQLVLIDYARHILHNLGHGFFGDPTKDCESYAFVDGTDYYIYTSYYDNGASPEEWTYRVTNCSTEEQAQQYFDYDADGAPEVYAREMPAFSQFRYDSQNKCYKATKTDEHDNQTNIEVYFKNGEIFKIVLDMPDNGVKYVLRNFGMTLVIFPTEIEENATLQTD